MRRSALASKIAARWGDVGGDLAVERVISELEDVQRYDIVAALRELERAGAGEFVVGRGGHKARFVWSGRKARVLAEAVGSRAESRADGAKPRVVPDRDRSQPKAAAPSVRSTSLATLEHAFHLRPGYSVTVRLPADVTRSEMERFCQFLQAIPFERTKER